MEKSFPKQLLMYTASLLLAAMAICVVYSLFQPTWFKNIKAEITSQPYARTITVSAEGKIND